MIITLWDRIYSNIISPIRRNSLVRRILPHVQKAKRILDLGAGDGALSHRLSDVLPNVSFVGVDIVLQPQSFIPVKHYDGRKLPFPSHSFDTVLIVDVLHHDTDPFAILKEARRVSTKYILIKDHYWVTGLDRFFLKVADYLGNKVYGVALPYNYFTMKQWRALVAKLPMSIEHVEYFKIVPGDMAKQVLFVLKK